MVWGGRWERGSGWGACVHPWQIRVDVWQNQYNIVKLKKIHKLKKKKKNYKVFLELFYYFIPIVL